LGHFEEVVWLGSGDLMNNSESTGRSTVRQECDCNCLAKLKQQNHEDRKDRKEKLLRGLCGLRGSNSNSMALFGTRFTDG
jgi:hypothetical protein